jgi:peptidoglycan hydrolase-like protein with peptidoglycan-binding domain
VHSAGEPKRLNWLIANVKKFGFSWEVVPEEPWHIRYVCGDAMPEAVVAYMNAKGLAKPAGGASTASVPPAGGASAGGDDGGDLNPGDTGPRVTKLQEELAERGFYKGAFDGSFGAETAKAVTAFKQANKLGADPKAGSRVLGLLGIGL